MIIRLLVSNVLMSCFPSHKLWLCCNYYTFLFFSIMMLLYIRFFCSILHWSWSKSDWFLLNALVLVVFLGEYHLCSTWWFHFLCINVLSIISGQKIPVRTERKTPLKAWTLHILTERWWYRRIAGWRGNQKKNLYNSHVPWYCGMTIQQFWLLDIY